MEKIIYHNGYKIRKEKVVEAFKSLVGLTEEEIEVVFAELKDRLKRRNREITQDIELSSDEISKLINYYSKIR